ncbi:MAG: pathogenicity protein [Rhodanobacteraceae bacterium]|jgi:translocation and assembly module TamB|nr:pathogenicity protein [Rhodanobacteraceae bacterium]
MAALLNKKPSPALGFALPRLLAWLGLTLAALVLLVAIALAWLLGTESGARFALARAAGATAGKLTVDRVGGRLGGPLTLDGLRWHDAGAGVDARIGHLRVDLAPLALLGRRVRVTGLDLAGINVALTTVPPQSAQPSAPFSLAAPIDLVLDRLALDGATLTQDGQPLFALDHLDLAGAWTRDGAVVKRLALRAPDGQLDLNGTISALAGYPGDGATTFRWKVADIDYAGTLKAHGDGRQARLELALSAPTAATLQATLTQTAEFPWTAALDVPLFDPKRIRKDAGVDALALALTGSGDKAHGALGADLELNGHRVRLEPLRYALAGQTLSIEALTLKSPEAAGALNAHGHVQLDAQPPSATLALDWNGVELPADLVGQALVTHGQLDLSGSAEAYRAHGALSLGPPGQLADLALDLDGTPRAITLKHFTLKQAGGGLDTHGTVTLQPALGWQLSAQATRLDPGAFVASWPGALDFDLASDGSLTDRGPEATLKLDRLGGSLRQRPLSGRADLTLKPGYVVDGTLTLASGKSRIDVTGRGGGERTDATLKLALASLADWLPEAAGRLDGEFRVQGRWPQLAVAGSAHGSALAAGGTHIDALDLVANVSDLQAPQGTLSLKARTLAGAGLAFDALEIEGSGTQQAHQLTLDARGTPLGAKLALAGSAGADGRWSGTLKALDLAVKDAPPLALEQPVALAWDGKRFNANELCLAGGGPTLCLAGSGGTDGSASARYRIEQLPLALLVRLAAPDAPLKVVGTLGGSGTFTRAANGALDGQATLASAQGSIGYPDNAEQPLLAWTGLALDAQLSPQATHASVRAALDHDGRLDGTLTLGGTPGSAQALSGRVELALNSLAFVELLTPEVANTKGRLVADYTLGGTTAAPALSGALTLKEFATEVPAAGLKLHDGDINLRALDAGHFALDGTLKSGDGTLALSGSGGVGADAPFKASVKGDNFLAADIPAARVLISPDLTLERGEENLRIGGSLTIPKANLDLAKLPGGGASTHSPDVVVTDAEQPAPGKPLPVVVAVLVKLGDEVKLAGFGLDGGIGGQLQIDQRLGRTATGTGTLNVTGTYKAYGQDLSIESGRLLFAGSELDNPGLDVRAVRKIPGAPGGQGEAGVTAGLQVRGTALVPVLTVFSQPSMEQSEALSYLITGKPLSSLKSGEGDMLGSAARALGSATGNLLAKDIGARMGVEAGVSDSAALGGAAFTVGKYLSPKLYLSYGVGLFTPGEVVTLKYLFNPRWNFEAQNATTGNRAGINYRYER